MAFKRRRDPSILESQDLEGCLAGLGMALACDPVMDANIEDTLLAAVHRGMDSGDLRVLGLVTSWLERHHAWINADRIIHYVHGMTSPRAAAFWISRAQSWATDIRWRRLRQSPPEPLDLLPVGTAFHLERKGEDPRFQGTALRIPMGTLRDRPGDVESAAVIARRHRAFHWRILVGPSFRADCLALAEAHPEFTASELARKTYASFATAWGVLRDLRLLAGTG